MALYEEIITVRLTLKQTALARSHAQLLLDCRVAAGGKAGGVSRIRTVESRDETLFQDACVGQLGQLGATLYLMGSEALYIKSREIANANPLKGDGGSDIPGYPIDIKSALIRRSQNSHYYSMHIKPAERHPMTIYVLATVAFEDSFELGEETIVSLVGWAHESDLPKEKLTEGIFKGSHELPRRALRPMHLLHRDVSF